MSLQLDRAGARNGELAILVKVVFHCRVIDDEFLIEPDADVRIDHEDAKMVPLTKWFVGHDQWIPAGRTGRVIEQAARTFVRVPVRVFRAAGLVDVPNLDLRTTAQVNA